MFVTEGNRNRLRAIYDAEPVTRIDAESGRRESNPRSQLGNGPKELRGS